MLKQILWKMWSYKIVIKWVVLCLASDSDIGLMIFVLILNRLIATL